MGKENKISDTTKRRLPENFNPVAYANFTVSGIAAKLERVGRDEAQTKALWLMNHVTGTPFGDILTKGIQPMIKEQWDALGEFLNRVITGEPIQYVVGNADFMGRIFFCDKRALIPRPETEELVAAVVALAKQKYGGSATIVDIGTGTGCIAISIALELPSASVTATDLSADALELARLNATAHGQDARVTFREADLLAGFAPQSADIIVSNPPYIGTNERVAMAQEILEHEPHAALFAGGDGLDVIRRLAPQAFEVLRPGGKLFIEIGESQGASVSQLLAQSGFADVSVAKDFSGHDRIVRAVRP